MTQKCRIHKNFELKNYKFSDTITFQYNTR